MMNWASYNQTMFGVLIRVVEWVGWWKGGLCHGTAASYHTSHLSRCQSNWVLTIFAKLCCNFLKLGSLRPSAAGTLCTSGPNKVGDLRSKWGRLPLLTPAVTGNTWHSRSWTVLTKVTDITESHLKSSFRCLDFVWKVCQASKTKKVTNMLPAWLDTIPNWGSSTWQERQERTRTTHKG